MERGAFEIEERKLPQGEAEGRLDSIFQAPSTENGADKPRPLFRIATSPSTGITTRKTYAITKLRFACEIALSPLSRKRRHLSRCRRRGRDALATAGGTPALRQN